MDLSQIELIYRAEGNANLVLVLPQHKKVLRLPKTTLESTEMDVTVNPELHIAYIELMTTRLLGEAYSNPAEIVCISSIERSWINQFTAPFRPAMRLNKEFCGQFGLLFPDATHLPDTLTEIDLQITSGDTYSVEIKPKQGWMIQEIDLPDGNLFDLKNIAKCRYCCMQYLKLKQQKIASLSNYCPMDIFSGDTEKMKSAISSLFISPQNNLRIFKNGILIYSKENQDMTINQIVDEITNGNKQVFQQLIINCLLHDFDNKDSILSSANADTKSINDQTCNSLMNLPSKCILKKILDIQQLAKRNIKNISLSPLQGSYSKTKTYSYLPNLVAKRFQEFSLPYFTSLEQYTFGATLMDCSIMIAFQKGNNLSEDVKKKFPRNLIHCGHQKFLAKVSVLDLDPKPDSHFLKYVRQTNEAYSATKEYEENK